MMSRGEPLMPVGVGHRYAALWKAKSKLRFLPFDAIRRFLLKCSLPHQKYVRIQEYKLQSSWSACMGDSQDVLEMGDKLLALGLAADWFERICPDCQSKLAEFWQCLDGLETQLRELSQAVEDNNYLRGRIARFRDFGEPLDDL